MSEGIDLDGAFVDRVCMALGLDRPADAQRVIGASSALWDALSELGVVDGYQGSEYQRVFPSALAEIRRLSNVELGEW